LVRGKILQAVVPGGKFPLRITTSKIVEVPSSVMPKPYKYHQIDPKAMGPHRSINFELGVTVQYQNIESLYKAVYKLYELFKTKSSFHYEQDLDKMFLY
jgi:hypothetical protein